MAFGSVKIVKIDIFIKGAQFLIKSAKNGIVFYKEVSPDITKNRDPWESERWDCQGLSNKDAKRPSKSHQPNKQNVSWVKFSIKF